MVRTKTIHNSDGNEKIIIQSFNDATRQWEDTPGEFDDEAAADTEIYHRWTKTLPSMRGATGPSYPEGGDSMK